MWYHPQAYFLSTKDVVAAWLVCAALATCGIACKAHLMYRRPERDKIGPPPDPDPVWLSPQADAGALGAAEITAPFCSVRQA
jgi:hypothetical protein